MTGTAFYLLSIGLTVGALFNLYHSHKPETTIWGIVIATISISVMWILIRYKVKVGKLQLACAEKRNHFFFKHHRADGTIRDVEVYSGPIIVKGKALFYSIVHDITDRKRAEKMLASKRHH